MANNIDWSVPHFTANKNEVVYFKLTQNEGGVWSVQATRNSQTVTKEISNVTTLKDFFWFNTAGHSIEITELRGVKKAVEPWGTKVIDSAFRNTTVSAEAAPEGYENVYAREITVNNDRIEYASPLNSVVITGYSELRFKVKSSNADVPFSIGSGSVDIYNWNFGTEWLEIVLKQNADGTWNVLRGETQFASNVSLANGNIQDVFAWLYSWDGNSAGKTSTIYSTELRGELLPIAAFRSAMLSAETAPNGYECVYTKDYTVPSGRIDYGSLLESVIISEYAKVSFAVKGTNANTTIVLGSGSINIYDGGNGFTTDWVEYVLMQNEDGTWNVNLGDRTLASSLALTNGNIQEIFPAISQANRASRPLVIIAEDFENDVMSTLVVNRMRGTFNGCAVKAPGVLHQMKVDFITDAAYATGGTVICVDLGIKLEDVTEKDFGKAKRIDVTAFTTTFVEGSADDELFNQRVNELRAEITKDEVNDYRRGVLRERLAKLVAGIGVVKVGGETRSIIKEKRDRIDDAICATREAIDGGIVAGAGSTLYKVGLTILDNEKTVGDNIIGNALLMPLNKILSNVGLIDTELHKTLVSNYTNNHSMQNLHGVDARTLALTTDLIKSGIIDPANVTLNAMTNAASVSALLIATDCMIGINTDKTPRIAMEHIDG
jgi:hypothetical protein